MSARITSTARAAICVGTFPDAAREPFASSPPADAWQIRSGTRRRCSAQICEADEQLCHALARQSKRAARDLLAPLFNLGGLCCQRSARSRTRSSTGLTRAVFPDLLLYLQTLGHDRLARMRRYELVALHPERAQHGALAR